MAYLVISNSFTRPSKDTPRFEFSAENVTFLESWKNMGLLSSTSSDLSEDGLVETINFVFEFEIIPFSMVIGSNIRIDPGWYEINIQLQEYADQNGIQRDFVYLKNFNADWAPTSPTQVFHVSDLF